MVKRLIVLRHAKSSRNDPHMPDHDRPLNKRGRQSARAIGKWLNDNGIAPDEILCSDAARTVETYQRLKIGGRLSLRPDLYLADADTIMDAMRSAKGVCVMIIGHNPGIAEFAQRLVADHPPHGRFADFPTGATLVLDVPMVDWQAGHFGSSRVVNFITPRELIGADRTGDKN